MEIKQQMFRLYKLLILVAFISCLNYLHAQSSYSELYNSYEKKNFKELKNSLNKYKADNSLDIKFFKALFYQDGEQAKNIFEDVYKHGKGRAKYYSAKKIMDYFYAKGYYVNAAIYQKYIVEHSVQEKTSIKTSPESQAEKYYVQAGAFSLSENAEQLVKFLKIQNINSKVVERTVNNSTLYCVWIPGKKTVEETLEFANKIKQKYSLDFQIMKN